VKQDNIDASIGLTYSLRLFQHYRRTGTLQAKVHHVPGVQGECLASLFLSQGQVTVCYVEDKRGQRLPVAVEELCRVDSDRGPFEWLFQAAPPPQASASPAQASAPSAPTATPMAPPPSEAAPVLSDAHIPVAVSALYWDRLSHWTPTHKQMLYGIFKMIDGVRTIREIKASTTLSPQVVEDALLVLLELRTITIIS
jgi:hypothetical protein